MAYTFKGGIRPDDHKYTKNSPIENVSAPETVSISLTQHVGVMCRPTVKVGERVLVGQLVGDIPGGLGCPVHASVSGKVIRIEETTAQSGGVSYNIVIENDGNNEISPDVMPFGKKLPEASYEEILTVIRNSGIAGMGGTAFPTHAKLAAARGRAETIIVNCCESEPFVCANHRLLLENPAAVINGVKIMMMAIGVKEAWLAVEGSRRDEVKKLTSALGEGKLVTLKKLSSKYPAGSEKQLIYALTKREVPEGRTPLDVGCVVFNAETCAAVYQAFATGLPLVTRVVTVDGDCVSTPKNLRVPIGTPYSHLIDFCGGLCAEPKKIISGGPMMGQAQWDPAAPVTKTTSAVLVFSDYFDHESNLPAVCIHCGRCVHVCPMKLMPLKIQAYSSGGDIEMAEKLGAVDCMECGSCSYVCPGGVPVTQLISRAKAAILGERRRAVGAAAKEK